MRNKIKEIMNKEEGFTLVELLAVIVILGIIVAIAIPAIGNVIGDSQNKATAAETELVEDAARLYYIENEDELENNATVDVSTLESSGYLDLRGHDELSGTVTVTIEGTNNVTYTFEPAG